MSDAQKTEPAIKPLNTHATSTPAGASVPDVRGLEGDVKPLDTHATGIPAGEAEDTTDNTHATSEPAN
ncbi:MULTISPECIES: hypothetical protein [Streptomyces]|uniref:Sigma-like protein n=2 Tax=Streptomyces TaxID=1883 RepID=A0ABU2RHJ2_9ACTN|nr:MULTISPECIES: hypothetical protein [unclassified Streptomyces]MBK3591711.1 hypothetical protein [Streptomyces sp. MBT51]MDT0428318.1 hypothetical protein [Streptomyces sp. DSM 41770]HBF85923.1 hypothetical protein [Streptomyces sp.]